MSEVHSDDSKVVVDAQKDSSSADGFVPKDAYQRVSADMHKYKQQVKSFQAELEQIKIERAELDKQKLIEQEKWQELYKRSEEKMKHLESERDAERNKFITSHKLNAVIQSVGGLKRPEYTKFIDTSEVEVLDDGSINEASVNNLAEKIRREYPELLKASAKSALPDKAATTPAQKPVSQMSEAERDQLRRSLLSNKN